MRRSFKTGAWVVGTIVALTVLLGGVILIGGNTRSGRAAIENLTAQLTGGYVKLTGLNGSFPTQLTLDELQLSDDRGIWLTAEHIALRWSPLALLDWHVKVETLQVARVHVERAPVSAKTPDHHAAVPIIDLGHASIDTLELSAQLAGAPASLNVLGGGHWGSLRDARADLTARRTNGEGNYEIHLKFDRARMDAALVLQEPADGPLENLLGVPGLGALSLSANLHGPRAFEHLQLALSAGSLRGAAAGSIDLRDRSADLNYTLDAPAMSPRPGIAWQRIALQGRWRGSITAPAANGHLQVDALQLPGAFRLAALNAELNAAAGKIELHARADGVELPGPQPGLLRASPLTVDASMRLNDERRPLQLTARHALFSLRAQAVTAGQQQATLQVNLPSLSLLSSLANQDIRGRGTIDATLTREGQDLRVALIANASSLDGGTAVWSGIVGDRAQLQLTGSRNEQTLLVERLRFTGRALLLSLNGTAARSQQPTDRAGIKDIRAHWDVELPDLGKLSHVMAGTLKASGSLNGPLNALGVDAQLKSLLAVGNSSSGPLSAEVHARNLLTGPRGTLRALGTLDGAPLRLDVSVQTEAGNAILAQIRDADWKSIRARGELTSATTLAQADGRVHVTVGQVGDLNRLFGINIAGGVDGNILLHHRDGRTEANIDLTGTHIDVGGVSGDAHLTAAGSFDALELDLAARSPALYGVPASVSATALLNLSARQLRVQTAAAAYRGQSLRLLKPAQLNFADGMAVDRFRVGVQQAVFELDGRVLPALQLHASLSGVDSELIDVFAPGLFDQGRIEAEAQLQGSIAAPTGHVRVKASGLRLADQAAQGLSTFDLHAAAQLLGSTAQIDADLSAGGTPLLKVTGPVPLRADAALALKIVGNLDIGLINPYLESRGRHATGKLSIDATLTGTLSAPLVDGEIGMSNGNFRDYSHGVNLTDISAQVIGSDGTLRIKTLTARAASGNLGVTGTIGVLQAGIPVDLHLTAHNAQPIVSKLVTANLDADLTVKGTARQRIDVAGSIHLDHATIDIPSSFPPNVAVLDVHRRGQTVPVPEQQLVVGFDVTVQAPQRILVQGRGLDAEMGGDLHLSGSSDVPLVSGGFDLLRGSFTLGSSRLVFSSGRVSFNGAGLKNRIDPSLDFSAQSTVNDATATLQISGLADAPRFDFSSTPPLPQDEIMALLLFGQNAAALSALQLAQIGAALATLGGVGGGGGFNPLVKLQKSLGLDRLSVGAGAGKTGTTENSGASIEAGRYVSKRIYVEAKQNTTGSSQVQVDVDLTKHLKLQTRLGNGTATTQGTTPENDPGSSIGLSYQFEY